MTHFWSDSAGTSPSMTTPTVLHQRESGDSNWELWWRRLLVWQHGGQVDTELRTPAALKTDARGQGVLRGGTEPPEMSSSTSSGNLSRIELMFSSDWRDFINSYDLYLARKVICISKLQTLPSRTDLLLIDSFLEITKKMQSLDETSGPVRRQTAIIYIFQK